MLENLDFMVKSRFVNLFLTGRKLHHCFINFDVAIVPLLLYNLTK